MKYESTTRNSIKYNKNNDKLKRRFKNTFKFFNSCINKFSFLLEKDLSLCIYMDDWEKFNKISFHKNREFYSNLNMADIIDADCMHAKTL